MAVTQYHMENMERTALVLLLHMATPYLYYESTFTSFSFMQTQLDFDSRVFQAMS